MKISAKKHGDVIVTEDELINVTESDLRDILGMTREQLHECFTEAKRLSEEAAATNRRIRYPLAERMPNGGFEVVLTGGLPLPPGMKLF
jgi:hypothetical protein